MNTEQILQTLLMLARISVVVILIGLFIFIVRRIAQAIYLYKRPESILELTPPSRGDKTPEATGQLLLSVFSLLSAQTYFERLIGRKDVLSLEIESTRSGGIRYLIHCHAKHVQNIKHLIASYLPELKVTNVDDYASGF